MKNIALRHLALIGTAFLSLNANAVLIDFDSLEVANASLNNISSGVYIEDGFTITGSNMYYAGQQHADYAGSAGMHLRTSNGLISLVDGSSSVFSIESIGLSILNPTGSSPTVTFTGNIFGGGTISQSFLPTTFGFTDYIFNAGFSNLVSLSWNQGTGESFAHQFDNINLNVTPVPEPSVLAMLGLGLFAVSRRKSRI